MAAPRPTGSQDLFDTYFRRADLDGDGRISGAEAVAFFQASNLPKNVLAQVWSYADAKKAGYLGRAEFYNALKLVTVAQSRRELTPEIVKAAIYSPASANIPAPKINLAATPSPQPRGVVPATQAQGATSMPSSVAAGMRGGQMGGTVSTSNQQVVPGQQNQFNGPRPAQPPQNFQSQGLPAGGAGAGAPRTAPNSVANHIPTPHMTPAVISSTTARPQESAPVHKPQDSSAPSGARALDVPSSQLVGKNPKELAASGNGFASDSLFGDVFAVTSTEPKQPTTGTTSTVGISSVSSGTDVAPGVAQSVVRQSSIPQHGSLGQHPVGPPRPVPLSPSDGMVQPTQPKRKMPELEKHLVDQLSKEEQDSLNSKFEEATAIDKKALSEIADSKQKIEFFHAKMQELVLYKSRCDNRYNEITERVSGDKREEKKMELYQAIVKFEEGKLDDGVVKERTEHIQSGLEELIRNLNERCKQYGVRGKPTTLVELPFGWQPGIQEGSADWDEEWDKLEEEGFVFVKEHTLDVQNVIAPPKEKSSAWKKEITASSNEGEDISSSDVDENGHDDGESTASAGKTLNYDSHDETDSVSSFNGKDKDHEKHDSGFGFGFGFGFDDFSIKPIKTGSTLSNDFLPPKLSIFSDSVPSPSANANDGFTAKPSLFADSVPSTPATTTASYSGNKSYFDDSVPSTPAYAGKSFFDDSVPSTPAYPGNMFPEKKSFFDDSVPSTPAYSTSDFGGKPFASETPRSDNLFPGRSPFMFDSVPSTPAAQDDFSSNTFSRFDSFNSNNNDAFSLSRSDSMRSTSEPDPFASRFDSFNYQRYDSFNAQSYDSSSNNYAAETPKTSLTRFDSIGSTRDADYSHGFGFDDHDPFGSTGPFKTTTNKAETPRSSDHWNAF
ncbi:hypothetical protein BRARA_G01070 [Brassica rapa]|uniref:EF-hand domain-containing protein n=1 Tax=Brassica campestris TaxID=3711 RepID=A0A397YUP4_BRACM|nr:hypothetical protein BRARA_G01070 [Brassica rapa]